MRGLEIGSRLISSKSWIAKEFEPATSVHARVLGGVGGGGRWRWRRFGLVELIDVIEGVAELAVAIATSVTLFEGGWHGPYKILHLKESVVLYLSIPLRESVDETLYLDETRRSHVQCIR
jgi:hypothetical protein